MRSYVFPATLERDGDEWLASVPALGISARGSSWRDALRDAQATAQKTVEDTLKAGGGFPLGSKSYDSYSTVVNVG